MEKSPLTHNTDVPYLSNQQLLTMMHPCSPNNGVSIINMPLVLRLPRNFALSAQTTRKYATATQLEL